MSKDDPGELPGKLRVYRPQTGQPCVFLDVENDTWKLSYRKNGGWWLTYGRGDDRKFIYVSAILCARLAEMQNALLAASEQTSVEDEPRERSDYSDEQAYTDKRVAELRTHIDELFERLNQRVADAGMG